MVFSSSTFLMAFLPLTLLLYYGVSGLMQILLFRFWGPMQILQ